VTFLVQVNFYLNAVELIHFAH